MKLFLLFIVILFSSHTIIHAQTLNDSIPPGKNFDKAAFRLWFPDGNKTISGIILLMPGSNGDGRGEVDDLFWQEFGKKHGYALLGCYFTDYVHDDMNIENYINAKEGSGQALLDVISLFAKKSGHAELVNAPLILWGHSAGGQFNYEFVCWKPELVIAFVVNKGGFYYTALTSKQARNVPGIFFTGEKDMESRKDIIKGIFSVNRRVGALWAFAEEPGAGHEVGMTKKLAGIFFDEIIPLRTHNIYFDKDNSAKLHALPVESGLIGDYKAKVVITFADVEKIDYPASWLPGVKTSEAWL
jgi:pimeloyl-ACP methyl ester carboxylesterase